MTFHQVSDKVEPEIITTVTKDCLRSDCCLSACIGETTLAGVSDDYDKNGNHTIRDFNNKIVTVCCRRCWKEWKVKADHKDYNKILIKDYNNP